MSDTETIAAVIAAHGPKRGIRDGRTHCVCGWAGDGYRPGTDPHREHQADMVSAALEPVIRERERAAWDTGKEAALRQADWEYGASSRQYIATNPYDTKEKA